MQRKDQQIAGRRPPPLDAGNEAAHARSASQASQNISPQTKFHCHRAATDKTAAIRDLLYDINLNSARRAVFQAGGR